MPLHPLTVHFPIVSLVLTCALMGWIWLKNEQNPVSNSYAWIMMLITLGAVLIAVISGRAESLPLDSAPELQQLHQNHELMGYGLLWSTGLLTIWMYLRQKRWKRQESLLFVIILLALSTLMVFTAHAGGSMVYEYGVGQVQ